MTQDTLAPALARPVLRAPLACNAQLVRLGALLVLLPIVIFAAPLAAPARAMLLLGVGLAAATLIGFTPQGLLAEPLDRRVFALCLAAAAALCLLGGEAHVFHSQYDWFVRDSVLADLVRAGWPVGYTQHGVDYLLRAPLGMYLAPALVGRLFGLAAAHGALLAQNAILLAIVLYFARAISASANAAFLIFFVFFGPLDFIPSQIARHFPDIRVGEARLDEHLLYWNAIASSEINFRGFISGLFWAPNHVLPGFLFAVLLLMRERRDIDLATLGMAFVALVFWSPLAMMGAAPFLLFSAMRDWRNLLARRNWLAAVAGLCFLPVAVYLTLDSGVVGSGWMVGADGFWFAWLMAMLFGAPQAFVVLARWKELDARLRGVTALAIALLLVIPFYRIGDNDFVMRAPIVALFVVALSFCDLACASAVAERRSGLQKAALLVAVLGAMGGVLEMRGALMGKAYGVVDCNLLTANFEVSPPAHPETTPPPPSYAARVTSAPAWLLGDAGPRIAYEKRVCWPAMKLGVDY